MSNRTKTVSMRLDGRMLDKLDRIAVECRITRTSLVEKVLYAFTLEDRPTQNAVIGRKVPNHV